MNKKSEYKKARKMIIENDGLIHLIGDYGIGKTYLINDIIKNEWKNLKIKNFDDFIFKKEEINLINLYNNEEIFQNSIKKYEFWKKILNFLKIISSNLIGIFLAIIPIIFSFKLNCFIKLTPLFLIIFIWIIFLIIYFKKIRIKNDKTNIWIFHNIDRFNWDVILNLFKWAYMNKKNKKIIFLYSTNNLKERYKEKFSYYPNNIEKLTEKFINKLINLNLYKEEISSKIFEEMKKEFKLKIKIKINISELDYLNFRIIKKCFLFINKNKKIIKLLKLDSNIIFLIQYLSHCNKKAYFWLKENIKKLRYKMINNSIINNNFKIPESLKSVQKILKNIESIIEINNTKINNKESKYLKTNLELYFITEETDEIYNLMIKKNTKKIIESNIFPHSIKRDYLLKKFKNENLDNKYEIIQYIIEINKLNSEMYFYDQEWILSNIKNIFKKINIENKFRLIRNLWDYSIENSKIFVKNWQKPKLEIGLLQDFEKELFLTICIIEFFKKNNFDEKSNQEIINITKWMILEYWKNLKNFNDEFYVKKNKELFPYPYETFMLLKMLNKKVKTNINKWISFYFVIPIILIFKNKKDILNDKKIKSIHKNSIGGKNIPKENITSVEWKKHENESKKILNKLKIKFKNNLEYLEKNVKK